MTTRSTLLACATVLLLQLPLLGCASAPRKPATAERCPQQPLSFRHDAEILEILRVYTGADGLSHSERLKMPAQTTTYLGAVLRQFQLGDPSNLVIVGGPPDFHIPRHPSPYREVFLILAGSSVIELSDGTEQPLNPGSIVLFEDVTGQGHAGRFGPCGYVAVDIQFKPVVH